MNQGLIVALVILLVVGFMVYGYLASEKRKKELSAWAAAKGFSFTPAKDRGLDGRFPNYGCLHQGSRRYGFNIIEGTWQSHTFLGFDYHYETYSTDSKGHRQTHHHHFSAVILSSALPLKPLFLRAEGFFDRVKSFFGYDDIDFESAEFSKAFYVSAKDKRWAYDVLHARAIELLLDSPRFSIQFDHDTLIAFRGNRFSPQDFESAATVLNGLLDQLPDYVVQQLTQSA